MTESDVPEIRTITGEQQPVTERKGGVDVGGRPDGKVPTDARPQGVDASQLAANKPSAGTDKAGDSASTGSDVALTSD